MKKIEFIMLNENNGIKMLNENKENKILNFYSLMLPFPIQM
jgi:hypothetical protein